MMEGNLRLQRVLRNSVQKDEDVWEDSVGVSKGSEVNGRCMVAKDIMIQIRFGERLEL